MRPVITVQPKYAGRVDFPIFAPTCSPNLGIETGRHTKAPKPQEQRLCLYCRNGCVDDEIHFLTACDIHTEIRQRFVSNIKSHIDRYEDLPANGKFVTVMRSSSAVVIKELAKFVYKAFQQRLHHVQCLCNISCLLCDYDQDGHYVALHTNS